MLLVVEAAWRRETDKESILGRCWNAFIEKVCLHSSLHLAPAGVGAGIEVPIMHSGLWSSMNPQILSVAHETRQRAEGSSSRQENATMRSSSTTVRYN